MCWLLKPPTYIVMWVDSFNVDNVPSVGQNILDGMVDYKVLDYIYKKIDQAVTLEAESSMGTGTETMPINPLLLFQHLVTARMRFHS